MLSANSDLLLESLTLLSQIERTCGCHAAEVFALSQASLGHFLRLIRDELQHRNTHQFLDTTSVCGAFAISKFVSFAQQTEHNTSIATDGEYLYMYVAIP